MATIPDVNHFLDLLSFGNLGGIWHLFHQDHLTGKLLRSGLQLVEINAAGQVGPIERHRVCACCVPFLCQNMNLLPQQVKYNESNIAILR